jgi:hypothetical protein
MKKVYFIAILVFFAAFSYADDIIEPPNNNIYVEGTASRADHREFFQINFNMEATALGYTLTDNRGEAGYIYRYNVVPNMVDSGGIERLPSPDEPQYVIQMSVIRNEDNFEVLSYNVPFTDLDELYEYNQFLFFRSNLPFAEGEPVYVYPDTSWRDKWIYLRVSFDYPISFYVLQPDGLFAGKALYKGDINSPDDFSIPLNHRVSALPGATVGVEVQFLNFMSLEVNFQVSLGDTVSNKFLNMAAGAQLKFPLKFANSLMIEPYGAFTYPLKKSDVFASIPPFLIGGGLQVCTKGGKNGAFFIDVNYMFALKNTTMHNQYKIKGASDGTDYLFNKPEVINYKNFVIGLGVGYKFGLFNRKK